MTSWKLTAIGEFLFERQGKYKPNDEAISGLKRIEKIDFSGNFYIANKPSNTNMIMIRPGDLVISGINVSKGAMGIYDGDEVVTATIHYSSYTFDTDKINVEYFKRFLKSSEFIRLLQEQVKGGIKTEIKPKHILPLEINLPSLEEQGKTVSHFRSLESEDKELKKEINNQQTLLRKLRQQVLQEGIEGKLTADWREQNPDVEPASELLTRIKAEKEQLIQDKKIKKQKGLPPIVEEVIDIKIPDSWQWVRLRDITCPLRGITYGIVKMGARPQSGGVFALRCSDVKFRKFDLSGVRKVSEEISNQYKRTVLDGGEILLNIRGTLGGCAIVHSSMKGYNIAREVGLVPLQEQSLNGFVLNVLTSPYFNNEIESNLRGIAYKGLNLNILNTLLIPIPPLLEQKVIVSKVEKLLVLCDQLEAQITSNQTHAEQLMQAVLKEAFQQSDTEPQEKEYAS